MKIGDRVLFTFLGQPKKGEIIMKHSTGIFKVKSDGGTIYPFIYSKKPVESKKKTKTKEVVSGYIIELIK